MHLEMHLAMRTILTIHVFRHVGLCLILARLTNGYFWSALTRPEPVEHPAISQPKVSEPQHDFVFNSPTGDKELPNPDDHRESPMSADDPGEKDFIEWSVSIVPHEKAGSIDQPRKRSFLKAASIDRQPLNPAPVNQKRHSITVHRMPKLAQILQSEERFRAGRLRHPHHASLGQHSYTPDYKTPYEYHAGRMEQHPYSAGRMGQNPYHADHMEQHPYQTDHRDQHPYHTDHGEQHPYQTDRKEPHPYQAGHMRQNPYNADHDEQHPYHADMGQHWYHAGRMEQYPFYDDHREQHPYKAAHMRQQPYQSGYLGQHPYHAGYVGKRRYRAGYTKTHPSPNDLMILHYALIDPRHSSLKVNEEYNQPSKISAILKTQNSSILPKSKSTDNVQSPETTSSRVDEENRIQDLHQRPSSGHSVPSPSQQPLHFSSSSTPVSFHPNLYSPYPVFVQESADNMADARLSGSVNHLRPQAPLSGRPIVSSTQHPPDIPSTTFPVSFDSNVHSSHPVLIQEPADLTHSVTPSPSLDPIGFQTPSSHRKMVSSTQQPTDILSNISPDSFESNPVFTQESLYNIAGVPPLLNQLGRQKPSSDRSMPVPSQQSSYIPSTAYPVWTDSNLASHPVMIQGSDDIAPIITSSPSIVDLESQTPFPGHPLPVSNQQPPEVFHSTSSVTLDPVFIQGSFDKIVSITPSHYVDHLEPQRPSPGGEILSSSHQTPNVPSTASLAFLYPHLQSQYSEFIQELDKNYADVIISDDLDHYFKNAHEARDFLKRSSIPKTILETPSHRLANRLTNSLKPLKRTLSHPPMEQPSRYIHPGHAGYIGQHPYPAGFMGNSVITACNNCLFPPYFVKEQKCEWKTVFKAVKGNGRSVYDDLVSPGGINAEIVDAQEIFTDLPFRDESVLDHWNSLYIKRVKLEVFSDGRRGTYLYFDGTASTRESWFSRERLIHSPYTDLRSKAPEIFSIQGESVAGRRFYINQSSGSCTEACGYLLVVDSSGTKECGHEKVEDTPYFLYSMNGSCGLWDADCFSHVGDRLVISVKICEFDTHA